MNLAHYITYCLTLKRYDINFKVFIRFFPSKKSFVFHVKSSIVQGCGMVLLCGYECKTNYFSSKYSWCQKSQNSGKFLAFVVDYGPSGVSYFSSLRYKEYLFMLFNDIVSISWVMSQWNSIMMSH